MIRRTTRVFAGLLGLLAWLSASGDPAALAQDAKRSQNAGRTGTYMARTSHPGYNYFVYVPKSYSGENPAGLHLFFHGQGGAGLARNVDLWAGEFLEKYNLIGINMYYEDGDNAKDTEGKVRAAEEAVAQVISDYKVIVGRGVIASFSGGGLPHSMFYEREAKHGRGLTWPFCHVTLYSSNYRVKPLYQKQTPMNWVIAVGQAEWSLAGLGADATARFSELLGDASSGGPSDLYLKVTKGKDHKIIDPEIAESSKEFFRSDLALAPFLYGPDFRPELKTCIEAANTLLLGKAMAAAEKIVSDAAVPEELKTQARRVKAKIEERAKAILALMKDLGGNDLILFQAYSALFLKQLQGLPEAKELKDLIATAGRARGFARAQAMVPVFQKNLRAFFSGDGMLATAQIPTVEQVKALAGEGSELGRMASEFLLLR